MKLSVLLLGLLLVFEFESSNAKKIVRYNRDQTKTISTFKSAIYNKTILRKLRGRKSDYKNGGGPRVNHKGAGRESAARNDGGRGNGRRGKHGGKSKNHNRGAERHQGRGEQILKEAGLLEPSSSTRRGGKSASSGKPRSRGKSDSTGKTGSRGKSDSTENTRARGKSKPDRQRTKTYTRTNWGKNGIGGVGEVNRGGRDEKFRPIKKPASRPHSPTRAPQMEPDVPTTSVPPPTPRPVTARPTPNPTVRPTALPTSNPTDSPIITVPPSPQPTAPPPTRLPTGNPTRPPTRPPTRNPTRPPTRPPTRNPTRPPTPNPTVLPTPPPFTPPPIMPNETRNPTSPPTRNPTRPPTSPPTSPPTRNPTRPPTQNPTQNPTRPPTPNPTVLPTPQPFTPPPIMPNETRNPTSPPTRNPTSPPTRNPTSPPTRNPTSPPTQNPTRPPTSNPTRPPTSNPTSNPTRLPTQNPTVDVGTGTGTESPTPFVIIDRCAYGCQFDEDCEYENSCYIYPQGASVEDCPGVVSEGVGDDEFPTGYCREPPDGTLVVITQDDISGTTLQQCQGDCDLDEDCAGDLKCFLREGAEPVPGCDSANDGIGWFDQDYCYDATGYLHYVDDELPEGSYGLCEGDCDSDADCIGDLVCYNRDGGEDVPGCLDPYNNITVHESIDFCCDPEVEGCGVPPAGEFELLTIGNNGDDIFPLPICRGDCDNDDECEGTFRCFQREGGEEVPGCTGSPNIPDDYCGDATNIMIWVSGNEGDVPIVPFSEKDAGLVDTGLLACMGDCDSSTDCAEGFVCYDRGTGDTSAVPGCVLWGDPDEVDNIDFCCDASIPECFAGRTENFRR